MGRLSEMLADISDAPEAEVDLIRRAGPLHDIGKIGIPDSILLKPGRLTVEEYEVIKTHTSIGADILAGSRVPILQVAEQIALTHHERWDGTGYPRGLSGTGIPACGHIVSVVDVLDALTSKRPYKEAWPLEDAMAEIESKSGSWFNLQLVDALRGLHEKGALALSDSFSKAGGTGYRSRPVGVGA